MTLFPLLELIHILPEGSTYHATVPANGARTERPDAELSQFGPPVKSRLKRLTPEWDPPLL